MKAAAIRCELVASRLARNSEWYTPGIQAAMYLGKCANNAALVCRIRGSKARLRVTVCRPCTWLIASYYSQTCRCISLNNISIFSRCLCAKFLLTTIRTCKVWRETFTFSFCYHNYFSFSKSCIKILYKDYVIKLLTWDFVIIIVLTSSIVFLLWYFLSWYI